jgi:two-component system, NtrC family, sensor histidine kinase KinB
MTEARQNGNQELNRLREKIVKLKKTLANKEWASEKTIKGTRALYQQLEEKVILEAKAKAFLERIIGSTVDSVIVSDFDGVITKVNEATLNLLGYEKEEDLLGQPVGAILAEEEEEEEETFSHKVLGEMLEKDTAINREVMFRSNDGQCISMFLSGSLVRDTDRRLLGIVIVAKNITELKKVEAMKDEFISSVSHELRVPLTILSVGISNLRDFFSEELSEKGKRVVESLDRNSKQLNRLVLNMLDLSRLESGHGKMNCSNLMIDRIIAEVVENHKVIAKEKDRILRQELSPNLPQVWADGDMMVQVITNLLSNALRFSEKEVVVKTKVADNFIQVSVQDDGGGLTPEDQKKLFDKFVQVRRARGSSGYKGTGIGLSICKAIVNQHRGTIFVESSPGKGATFNFTLPIDLRKSQEE